MLPLDSTSVPPPAFTSEVPPEIRPLIVAVTKGLETVMVCAAEERDMLPVSVRLLSVALLPAGLPPKVKPPLTVNAFPMVRAAVPAMMVTPSSRVIVPVP